MSTLPESRNDAACEDCGTTLVRGELDRSGQSWWCPKCAKANVRAAMAERAEWLADKIPAYGDYAVEAAVLLRKYASSLRSETRRSESGETFLGENDYREALMALTALFDDEGSFKEQHQDQASAALEEAEALLDGRAKRTETAPPVSPRPTCWRCGHVMNDRPFCSASKFAAPCNSEGPPVPPKHRPVA